jgi:PmbA protein
MERLLEIARKHADAVTVYGKSGTDDTVRFDNGRLKSADTALNSGTALTLVRDGKQGFAYTRNLVDREGLVRDALAALAGGVEAADPPQPAPLPVFDSAVEPAGGNAALAEESRRITDFLSSRVKGQVDVATYRSTEDVRVLTSSGVDASARTTHYFAMASVLYPGTAAGVHRVVHDREMARFPDADLQFVADAWNASQKEVGGVSGRTRALFLPTSLYALVGRLAEATSAKAVYEKVSPLAGRIGEQVLSEQLTLADEPLDDTRPGDRAFDDEGTPCRNLKLFERGVLREFYNDRFYARKTGTEPNGRGWRGDVTSRPSPGLGHLTLAPGRHSLPELLRLLGRGVVVCGLMGAHSGNRMLGEYSVGLAPGLWVENGEIVGRVKDAMVAGNVYEDLRNVVAVGDTLWHEFGGRFPAVLLDNISLTTRG